MCLRHNQVGLLSSDGICECSVFAIVFSDCGNSSNSSFHPLLSLPHSQPVKTLFTTLGFELTFGACLAICQAASAMHWQVSPIPSFDSSQNSEQALIFASTGEMSLECAFLPVMSGNSWRVENKTLSLCCSHCKAHFYIKAFIQTWPMQAYTHSFPNCEPRRGVIISFNTLSETNY